MRTIIAGSRDIHNDTFLEKAIEAHNAPITTVLCGMAKGADMIGLRYAKQHNILFEKYPALWDEYGNSAGYRRNVLMARSADACIVLWDGKSKGSKHMINIAKEYGLKVTVYVCNS